MWLSEVSALADVTEARRQSINVGLVRARRERSTSILAHNGTNALLFFSDAAKFKRNAHNNSTFKGTSSPFQPKESLRKNDKFALHLERMTGATPIGEEPSVEGRGEASAANELKKATFKKLVAELFEKQGLRKTSKVLPAIALGGESSIKEKANL